MLASDWSSWHTLSPNHVLSRLMKNFVVLQMADANLLQTFADTNQTVHHQIQQTQRDTRAMERIKHTLTKAEVFTLYHQAATSDASQCSIRD